MARTPAPKARDTLRVAPSFHLLRQFVILHMAKQGVATTEIADKLGHVRSFIIKQTQIVLKPRNALERRILKLANEHAAAAVSRAGMKGLLGGEDVEFTLAGGERPKLGSLAERKARRGGSHGATSERKARRGGSHGATSDRKAKKVQPKPAKTKPAKAKFAPKTPKAKKPLKGFARLLEPVVPKVPAPPNEKPAPKARVRTRKPKLSDLKAPLPAEKLAPQPTASENTTPLAGTTQDDPLLDSLLGTESPSPDTPI